MALGCLAASGTALSREKKPEDNAIYSVVVVSVDGKVDIEAVPSAEVAARRTRLGEGRPVAGRGDAQAPALVVLCEGVKGKRKADGVVRTIRMTLSRATGAAKEKNPPEKRARPKKKPKERAEPDDGDGDAGGGEGPEGW
jgi:hypothetical protein